MGRDAYGSWAQGVTSLNSTPAAARKDPAREVMEVLRTKGQVGHPPGISTDAQLGCSAMAYQIAEILPGYFEGDGSILVRLSGSCARSHPGAKHKSAQRPEVGCCRCCTKAMHIAEPSRNKAGVFPHYKAHGSQLRREHGPRKAHGLQPAHTWAIKYLGHPKSLHVFAAGTWFAASKNLGLGEAIPPNARPPALREFEGYRACPADAEVVASR